MDGANARTLGRWITGTLVAAAVGFYAPRGRPSDLHPTDPKATLASVGKRLSQSLSAGALTSLAANGDRLLAALNRSERDALARGHSRFQLDRPGVVFVAAPEGSAPFWLDDLGFQPTTLRIEGPSNVWKVYRKEFPAGRVQLGVNSLDRKAPAHYVVLIQARDGMPLEPAAIEGGPWRVVKAEEGVSLAVGIDLPIRSLSAELRGATLLQPTHDQRHATVLARGRVWKTRVVSRSVPDQVVVSLGADASRELVWSWRTDPETERSVVRFQALAKGTTEVAGPVREMPGDSRPVELPDLLNDPVIRRHAVRVKGLEPETTYRYSLGDGAPGGMSPWATVRTGPRPSSDVHLLYMGDPQCGLEGWGKLLASARRRHPEAGALLIAGDLVDRGNERSNWDHFFLRAAGVFDHLPVMPAVGNHEYLDKGPMLYQSYFRLPENGPEGVGEGLVYAFEYGDALVVVLDSTLAVSRPYETKRQADWLDGQLSRTGKRWKLVMFHHPIYASHPWRENPSLKDAWLPILDRHRVDLVLQGHDHAYLRTYPMRADRRVGSTSEGTVYVVSVSGDKYVDQKPRDYAEVAFTHISTYQTIDIVAATGRLVYRAWDASGAEVDRLEIVKPRARPGLATLPPPLQR